MDLDLMFYCAVVYNEHDGEYFAKPYYNFPKFDSSLENKVFPFFKEYKKNPDGKLAALKPMFSWLNYEV